MCTQKYFSVWKFIFAYTEVFSVWKFIFACIHRSICQFGNSYFHVHSSIFGKLEIHICDEREVFVDKFINSYLLVHIKVFVKSKKKITFACTQRSIFGTFSNSYLHVHTKVFLDSLQIHICVYTPKYFCKVYRFIFACTHRSIFVKFKNSYLRVSV